MNDEQKCAHCGSCGCFACLRSEPLADGGKGEAVYQVKYESGAWLDHDREKYEYFGRVGYETRILYTAPQAECAPREAQPVVLVDRGALQAALNMLRRDAQEGRHARGELADEISASIAAPTPERADADTAGAIPEGWKLVPTAPTVEMIVAIENQIDSQLTASGMDPRHMFRQDGEYVYEAMLAATPASQERADAGKESGK
jgi:hypothetical protein